jgi:prepilin-type N-terminal cleavage/methylation domain-containing protein
MLKKILGKRGFTLAEVLAVIGIITVLLGIAIPSVSAIRTNLKLLELDTTARSIFAAAQNRLLLLKAAGTLSSLPGSRMTQVPSDFADTGLFGTILIVM